MKLEPEQEHGRDWLAARTEAVLGDRAGLGKTAQALTAAMKLGAQRVAVLCPAVARVNWEREAAKWGLNLPVVRVTTKADHKLRGRTGSMLVIASYDGVGASKELRASLNRHAWDVLILDEGHRCKSPTANRTHAVYGVNTDGERSLSGKALYRWLLTASIMPNGPGELWSHLSALWPELITEPVSGTVMGYDQFLEKYCFLQYGDYGYKVVGYRDEQGIVDILNHIMLRRTHIEGLPDLVVRDEPILVDVGNKELARLEAHEEFDDIESVLNSAAARAEDIDSTDDDFIPLATLRRLTGVLKAEAVAYLTAGELGSEDKIILYAVHREVIDTMARVFKKLGERCSIVHGGIPDGQRNEDIDRFNTDPDCRVFIGQVQACKEAINLQGANRVRFVEQSFCPEDTAQCIARAHRRGQERQVFVDAVAVAGSIDEVVQMILVRKAKLISDVMEQHQND